MTDRRSFFKSISLIGAAAVGCPGIFIPKLEPVHWKGDPRQRLNPNWVNAPYEWYFVYLDSPMTATQRRCADVWGKIEIPKYVSGADTWIEKNR